MNPNHPSHPTSTTTNKFKRQGLTHNVDEFNTISYSEYQRAVSNADWMFLLLFLVFATMLLLLAWNIATNYHETIQAY